MRTRCLPCATDVASDQLCWHAAGRASEHGDAWRGEMKLLWSHVVSMQMNSDINSLLIKVRPN